MKTFFKKLSIVSISLLSIVSYSFAQQGIQLPVQIQNGPNGGTPVGVQLNNLLVTGQGLATTLYGSLFVVALIIFFFGLFKYMWGAKDEAGRTAGWHYMVYGIISLTVMFGIYGIVWFLSSSLGIGLGGEAPAPKPPTLRANIVP